MKTHELKLFISLLQEKTGITFGEYQHVFLEKLLANRMKSLSVAQSAEYLTFLCSNSLSNDKEWQVLIRNITVPQTAWFRNPEDFQALASYILPQITAEKKTIRILSAGCSTGEEAYSILISVLESPAFSGDLQIFLMATDINSEYLEVAKKGRYKAKSLQVLPTALQEKYFLTLDKEEKEVKEEFRSQIVFSEHNLQTSLYPKPQEGFWDLIFCRNVLIYFAEEEKQKALEKFYEVLFPQGYLFLGYSESIFQNYSLFSLAHFQKSYFYRKVASPFEKKTEDGLDATHSRIEPRSQEGNQIGIEGQEEPLLNLVPRTLDTVQAALGSHLATYEEVLASLQNQENTKAREELQRLLTQDPSDIRTLLTLGNLCYSSYEFWEALDLYERAIQQNSLLAEPYLLAGMTLYTLSQWQMATSAFKKACYLESDWMIPRFYLGILAEKMGKREESKLYYRQVERIFEKGAQSPQFLSYLDDHEDFFLLPSQMLPFIQKKLSDS